MTEADLEVWDDEEELAADHLVALPDRRFYAFVLDRLIGWAVIAAAVWACLEFLLDDHQLLAVLAGVGALLVVWLAFVVATGVWGASPGKALLGLRVLSADDARPIGVVRAALRGAIVGISGLPFLGLGAAALGWTALVDPSGWRRGWHDLKARSVVVDVRPLPASDEPEEEAPRGVVNLTAMRLVPASPTPPRRIPTRGPRGPREPVAPLTEPPEPPRPTRTPRLGLGWPLVGDGPEGSPALPAPPAERAPARPAAPAAQARWQVAFDTGEAFEVRGLTLIGRRPEARQGEPVKRLLTLPSDDMSLSKTHAQFQVVPDGALVVMDRGSTNGTILVRAGGTRRLAGGTPATLREGDRVRFGDREMSVTRLG